MKSSAGRIALALAAFAWLAACGGESETPTAPDAKAPGAAATPPSAAKVPVLPSESPPPAPSWTGKLPPDFPADIPQFPGAKVVGSRASHDQGLAATFSTEAAVDEVVSFYSDAFAAQGWSTDIRTLGDGTAVFADKENRTATAMVTSAEGTTHVNVLVIQRP